MRLAKLANLVAAPVEPEFGLLLVRQLSELRKLARRLARSETDAQDLVQETCRRALGGRAQFRYGSDLRAWLFCIMRNIHHDQGRRRWRDVFPKSGDHLQADSRSGEGPALWAWVSDEDLADAVASLPPDSHATYVRHHVEGVPYHQIARELNVAPSTVGTRLMRARKALRRYLLARISRTDQQTAEP